MYNCPFKLAENRIEERTDMQTNILIQGVSFSQEQGEGRRPPGCANDLGLFLFSLQSDLAAFVAINTKYQALQATILQGMFQKKMTLFTKE